jgi:hypothetical protein
MGINNGEPKMTSENIRQPASEEVTVNEETGVIIPVETSTFLSSVRYLIDKDLVSDFEEYLANSGHSEIWIDIATANSLKQFLYKNMKKDAGAHAVIRCGCKSWKGPKFPKKEY